MQESEIHDNEDLPHQNPCREIGDSTSKLRVFHLKPELDSWYCQLSISIIIPSLLGASASSIVYFQNCSEFCPFSCQSRVLW